MLLPIRHRAAARAIAFTLSFSCSIPIDGSAADDPSEQSWSERELEVIRLRALLTIPRCDHGILDALRLEAILPPRKRSEGYAPPDEETRRAIAGSVHAVFDADFLRAVELAAAAGYVLCGGEREELGIMLWRPLRSGTGHALFAWRVSGGKPLVVEVPHPVFDYLTLSEGTRIFEAIPARAIIVSGTHRCASSKPSGCDGASSVCDGAPGSYRESDMAHAAGSVFQIVHEIFAERSPADLFVSLHGAESGRIIVSDGTTFEAEGDRPVSRLAAALQETLPGASVESCNATGGARLEEDLCGTTNIQGRSLNGSSDACAEMAPSSSGRFLHLEQSLDLRRSPAPVIEALARILR